MIYKINIKDPTKTPIKWFAKIEAFKSPRALEFKDGINVLWGPNGSGKTTLMTLLARLFHCEQGNHPMVTQESLGQLTGGIGESVPIEEGIELKHDGQGVRHFDPGRAVGLSHGAFDWDFGVEGIRNTMFHGSAGQTGVFRFDRIMNEIIAGAVPEVAWKMKREHVNDLWRDRIDVAARMLTKNADVGQPTILLDEPERSFDFNAQIGIWRLLRAYSDEVQFIVASHSMFALNIPGANYIDLSTGYLKRSHGALAFLQTWPEDKPKKLPDSVAQEARAALEKVKQKK